MATNNFYLGILLDALPCYWHIHCRDCASNLSVALFGPVITPVNAFVLIGLDLALRDWLHIRLKGWQMLLLIIGAGLLSYLFNPDARQIALASACAFTLAATADWPGISQNTRLMAGTGQWV